MTTDEIKHAIDFEKGFLSTVERFLKETPEENVIEILTWQGRIEAHLENIKELEQKLEISKQNDFKEYLKWAANEVSNWPDWKKNLFGCLSRKREPDEQLDY